MNKKGALPIEIGIWIIRILLVIIVLAGMTLQIRTFVNAKVSMDAVEPTLLAQVISTSPSVLYTDDAGTRHNKVSVEQFAKAEAKLNYALDFNKEHAAAKITLQEIDGREIDSVVLNRELYGQLSAMVPELLGQTVQKTTHKRPIIILENKKERKGMLLAEVLQPR